VMSPTIALSTIRLQCLAVLWMLLSIASAQMPYNPTSVFANDSTLYVFRPSAQSSTTFELVSLDVSTRIDAANLPYTTLYPTLPFLKDTTPRAFTPILDAGGNITVYTGDCSHGASGGEVWTLAPSNTPGIHGSWKQEQISVKDNTHTDVIGPNYLNGGIPFSSTVGGGSATTGAYFFGGMCPFANATSNWQSSADYSNLMVTLQPASSRTDKLNYALDVSSSRGPPVPEAGFTVTGLTPTFSNRSDDRQTQQQNFLLIGGHTSAAFINMSQVALFSLPEQGWTFIGVEQPDTTRAKVATIDPRSGHTAVITQDGQSIVVFGGWVGDVNTPAEPQLAILNVAEGYGGRGEWQWGAPSTSGAGLPTDSGLYGHGAAMLPGGVLMITGGYSIPAPTARMRRANPAANSKSYFLNVTSNTWVTDYSPPATIPAAQPVNSGPLSSPGQKVGLGVGIGVGMAAVCGFFAFYMWYTRRLRKHREVREKQIQDLAFTTHRYNLDTYTPGFDGRSGQTDALDYLAGQNGNYYFPPGTQGGQGWKKANGGDAERTGLFVEIPSPTRGLRRSLSGRPGYAMGSMRGAGQIHPIDELEEEQDEEEAAKGLLSKRRPEMAEAHTDRGTSVFDNAPTLDPFTDGNRDEEHRSTSLMNDRSGLPEGIPWSTSAPHSSHMTSNGRLSPDKSSSDRTSSNLSERSAHSELSWASTSGGVARTASLRSAAILNNAANTNPFKTPTDSPTHERSSHTSEDGPQSPTDPRTQSLTSIRSIGYAEVDSFRTAQSSFAHLQAEGEALLGGNPERPRPGTASSSSNTYRDTDHSSSRAATATPATSFAPDPANISRPVTRERRRSWLGSVRRVLIRSTSGAERTRSLTTTMPYQEPYTDNPISPVSPTNAENRKSMPASTSPRRAASDASFWKSKRGAQDWADDEQDPRWKRSAGDDWGAPEDVALAERERVRQEWRSRGNLLVNLGAVNDTDAPQTPIHSHQLGIPATDERPSTPVSEADWDVEAAVERRVVQVMFTVPKSKLRVVNADVDGSSLMSDDVGEASVGSPSRVKNLAGRFEKLSSSPRASPIPSPAGSIKSVKVRGKGSKASLGLVKGG
jgi:hypothetical protein